VFLTPLPFRAPHTFPSLDVAVDSKGISTILTGSWRPNAPLELWDYAAGTLIDQIEWKDSLLASQPCTKAFEGHRSHSRSTLSRAPLQIVVREVPITFVSNFFSKRFAWPLGNAGLLYTAQFSKSSSGRFIVAGGSGSNEARVYDRDAGTMTSHSGGGTALVGTVAGMSRGVFSADWSPMSDAVAVGTGDGAIRILEVSTP
jgi:WD40 repeat protein